MRVKLLLFVCCTLALVCIWYIAILPRDNSGPVPNSSASNPVKVTRTATVPPKGMIVTVSDDGVAELVSMTIKLSVTGKLFHQSDLSHAHDHYLQPVGDKMYVVSTGYSEYLCFDRPAVISFTMSLSTPSLCSQGALMVYAYDGDSWSTNGITNQTVTQGENELCKISAVAHCVSRMGVFYNYLERDALPPRSFLSVTDPSYDSGRALYVGNGGGVRLTAVDDKSYKNDGAGTVNSIYYAVDSPVTTLKAGVTSQFTVYSSTFGLPSEGAHTVKYGAVDVTGTYEALRSGVVYVDITPPVLTMLQNGVAVPPSAAAPFVEGATITFRAADPLLKDGAPGSGFKFISYLSSGEAPEDCHFQVPGYSPDHDAAPGTCANPIYAGGFTLRGSRPNVNGLYEIHVSAVDNAGNHVSEIYRLAARH